MRRALHDGQTARPWHENATQKVLPALFAEGPGKTDNASLHVETCLIARQDNRLKLVANFRKTAEACCFVNR